MDLEPILQLAKMRDTTAAAAYDPLYGPPSTSTQPTIRQFSGMAKHIYNKQQQRRRRNQEDPQVLYRIIRKHRARNPFMGVYSPCKGFVVNYSDETLEDDYPPPPSEMDTYEQYADSMRDKAFQIYDGTYQAPEWEMIRVGAREEHEPTVSEPEAQEEIKENISPISVSPVSSTIPSPQSISPVESQTSSTKTVKSVGRSRKSQKKSAGKARQSLSKEPTLNEFNIKSFLASVAPIEVVERESKIAARQPKAQKLTDRVDPFVLLSL